MRFGEREFLLLLLVNTVIVVLYVLVELVLRPFWGKERSYSVLLKAGVMLLCPLVGIVIFALCWLFGRMLFWRSVQLEDVLFSKERVRPQMAAEEERESNLVPVEEAVAVADTGSMREMMMQVVRGDVRASASAIAMALGSDDSEVTHYAAAALQGVLNEFRTSVQKNYRRITAPPEAETAEGRAVRLELAAETIDSMSEFLRHRLLPAEEQREYAAKIDEIGERLLEEAPERMTAKRFETVSMQLLAVEDYENCRKWCLRAYAAFPGESEPYACLMKLYYTTGSREQFFRVMEELRTSEVPIDQETLEMVRVFR